MNRILEILGFNTDCKYQHDIDGNYTLALAYALIYFFYCGLALNVYFIWRLIRWTTTILF